MEPPLSGRLSNARRAAERGGFEVAISIPYEPNTTMRVRTLVANDEFSPASCLQNDPDAEIAGATAGKYHNGGYVWRCFIRAVLSARSSRSLRFQAWMLPEEGQLFWALTRTALHSSRARQSLRDSGVLLKDRAEGFVGSKGNGKCSVGFFESEPFAFWVPVFHDLTDGG